MITTSDSHDPELVKMAPPETVDARSLAYHSTAKNPKDGSFKRGFRAYSSLKLGNLLTSLALDRQPEAKGRAIVSIAFNPGFTPDTSIGRNQAFPIRMLMKAIVPVVKLFVPINSAQLAGEALAGLVLGTIDPPPGKTYASLVRHRLTWPEPGGFAKDVSVQDDLWKNSETLIEYARRERVRA